MKILLSYSRLTPKTCYDVLAFIVLSLMTPYFYAKTRYLTKLVSCIK